jgi:hypothetical protein
MLLPKTTNSNKYIIIFCIVITTYHQYLLHYFDHRRFYQDFSIIEIKQLNPNDSNISIDIGNWLIYMGEDHLTILTMDFLKNIKIILKIEKKSYR